MHKCLARVLRTQTTFGGKQLHSQVLPTLQFFHYFLQSVASLVAAQKVRLVKNDMQGYSGLHLPFNNLPVCLHQLATHIHN